MIWLWRICFSGLCLAPVWCASVKGSVELTNSRDPGARHHDYKGVVVWLEPANGDPAPRIPPRHYVMQQKDKHFRPHVLGIPVGATVDFPNDDPFFHSVFSKYDGQQFEVNLYRPNTSRKVVFKSPGIVRVFCNIHPTMSAVIAVLDTPWFAVSDAAGGFEIHGVPPGSYTLHVFHERATDETLHALVQPVTIENTELRLLGRMAISETGYIPAPHKDKWDKDYPPVIDDQPGYRPNQ
jgi:plastocyanin